jgi:hypothetical protein
MSKAMQLWFETQGMNYKKVSCKQRRMATFAMVAYYKDMLPVNIRCKAKYRRG